MLIIVDKKMPAGAREKLQEFGEVVEFATKNICYEAVSGHPDVFLFQSPEKLIIAPNLPDYFKSILQNDNIEFIEGINPVGEKYPGTAHYNAVYTKYGIIHNEQITDPAIKSLSKPVIHCNQAYTRCNTIEAGSHIITSDRSIEKSLLNKKLNVFYVNPENIILPGHKHGFFGGCCGIWENKFFICGSLDNLAEAEKLRKLLTGEGFEIIDLYDGELFDVGGIFFY